MGRLASDSGAEAEQADLEGKSLELSFIHSGMWASHLTAPNVHFLCHMEAILSAAPAPEGILKGHPNGMQGQRAVKSIRFHKRAWDRVLPYWLQAKEAGVRQLHTPRLKGSHLEEGAHSKGNEPRAQRGRFKIDICRDFLKGRATRPGNSLWSSKDKLPTSVCAHTPPPKVDLGDGWCTPVCSQRGPLKTLAARATSEALKQEWGRA